MGWIWTCLVGAIIGAIAGAITKRGAGMGFLMKMVAGLLGSAVGQTVLPRFGPSLGGMALIPSIVGAVVVILIFSLISGHQR